MNQLLGVSHPLKFSLLLFYFIGFSSFLSGCLSGRGWLQESICHAPSEPCPFSGTAGTRQGWQRRLRGHSGGSACSPALNIPEKRDPGIAAFCVCW